MSASSSWTHKLKHLVRLHVCMEAATLSIKPFMSCLRGLRTTRAAFTTSSSGRGSKCHKELMSLCAPCPLPPSPFCTHPVRQHPFARMRASVRHANFPCNQQLLLLLPLHLPSLLAPLRSVSGKLHDNNNTTSVFFGGRGACRTSKCHEKCMSCCCRCCCYSKCRQRLIISNWVNGTNSSSISSASGSGRGTVWFDKATSVDRILGPLM